MERASEEAEVGVGRVLSICSGGASPHGFKEPSMGRTNRYAGEILDAEEDNCDLLSKASLALWFAGCTYHSCGDSPLGSALL